MDRFDHAQANRQAIIDYSLKFPERIINHRMAAMACEIPTAVAYRACRAMERDGEMSSIGRGYGIQFKAIAMQTLSADYMRERAANKKIAWNERFAESKKTDSEPWRYVHRLHREIDKVPPIPNQGGQGAVRVRVSVASCAGMV